MSNLNENRNMTLMPRDPTTTGVRTGKIPLMKDGAVLLRNHSILEANHERNRRVD